MFRTLAVGLVAVALSVSTANATGIQRADCTDLGDYLAHNGATLTQIVQVLVTEVGSSFFTLPGLSGGEANVHAVGAGFQVSKLYAAAYVSPEAIVNELLGLVCLEFTP